MSLKSFKLIALALIILGGLVSCGILFPSNYEPKAKVCFFDPLSKSIVYKKKKNGEGIKRIEIELVSTEGSIPVSYLKKNYSAPVQSIDLSVMDTVRLMQNIVQIKIWDRSPIIEDYNLEIKPSDWKQGKLVYSRHSVR